MMALTAEHKNLVQATFVKVAIVADKVAELFYNHLFEIDPTTKPLFAKTDMKGQGSKLMQMIGTAVGGLDRLEDIVPHIEALGKRHVSYGVKQEQYDTVGEALIWTLEQGLGSDFTPEVKAAWSEVYTFLANVAIQAGYKSRITREEFVEHVRGEKSLSGYDLIGLNLGGVLLNGTKLTGANLAGANLAYVDLSGAILVDTMLAGANLTNANLSEAKLVGTNLVGANLTAAKLSHAEFSECDLSGVNLTAADLTSANMKEAKLLGASFICANMTEANFQDANLVGTIMTGANLTKANLSNANLRGSNMTIAILKDTNLEGAKIWGIIGMEH